MTLKLDHDVATALKRLRKGRSTTYRELVNEALRRGIEQMSARPSSRPDFQTRSVALGRLRISSIDNVSEVLAIV
jgi:hypothetical protein